MKKSLWKKWFVYPFLASALSVSPLSSFSQTNQEINSNKENLERLEPRTLESALVQESQQNFSEPEQFIPIVNKKGKTIDYTTFNKEVYSNLVYGEKVHAFFDSKTSQEIINDMTNPKSPLSFYGDIALNPNIQTYYANNENFTLNYYATADIDLNNISNWTDYNSILGNTSDRADVNGDGNPGQSSDKTIFYQYLTDNVSATYLPAYWDYSQNRLERISWFEKVKLIDQTQVYHSGWTCYNYSMQFQINTSGVENISGSGLGSTYDISKNARFNLPVYQVDDQTNTNVAHSINAILIGDTTANFNSWYFYEPQNDQRVYPGTASMGANSYVNVKRYCYYYNQALNQYMYGFIPLVNFQLQNSQVISAVLQNPDAVTNRTLKNVHLYGTKPVDVTVNWVNGQADTTANTTGFPTGVSPSGTQSTRSDSTNQDPNIYHYGHWNCDIKRDWKLYDPNSNGIVDSTLGSRRQCFANNGRLPQNIHVQDIEAPNITGTPNGQTYYYSQYPNSIPATQATDNSGYWYLKSRTITTNQNSDPNNCAHYSFTATVKDSISDYSNNVSVATSLVNIVLDPTTLTYVPGTYNLQWPASIDPSNTGGNATATNPVLPVTVTYNDISSQDSDPTKCAHYDFPITRTWMANTTPSCNNQVTATQMIYMNATNPPTLTFVPHDTIVPIHGCITPQCLGVAQGVDNQTGQPVTPANYDSITDQDTGYIDFDRHHWVNTICGTPSLQGIQHVREMILDGVPIGYGKGNTFYLYPNPSRENVNFHYTTTKPEKIDIKVNDMTGKKLEEIVKDEPVPGEHNIPYDVSGLPSGTYLIQYTSPESTATKKLIKYN